jgi:hypothetical protein
MTGTRALLLHARNRLLPPRHDHVDEVGHAREHLADRARSS